MAIGQAVINGTLAIYTGYLNAEDYANTMQSAAVAKDAISAAQNAIANLTSEMANDGCTY